MITGILWIVIGVLLYALYACVMSIKAYQRNVEHLEHRLHGALEQCESTVSYYHGE